MKKAYYITGVSGTGKSTLADEFKKENFKVINIDSAEGLCHWQHRETKEKAKYFTGMGKAWINEHDYVCDREKLLTLIENSNENIIVVGITSNQKEYLEYFDKIFLLRCSEETLLERLSSREGNAFAKERSEQEQVLSWYKDFEGRMIDLGAIPINTEKPLKEVVDEIKVKMELS